MASSPESLGEVHHDVHAADTGDMVEGVGSRSASGSRTSEWEQQLQEAAHKESGKTPSNDVLSGKDSYRSHAKLEYSENRYYHGTDSDSAEKIQEHGADPSMVRTLLQGQFEGGRYKGDTPKDPLAASMVSHNFVTQELDAPSKQSEAGYAVSGGWGARDYARRGAGEANLLGGTTEPKVVRSYLPPGTVKLDKDPDSAASKAYRTPDLIKPGLILRSHADPIEVTDASEHFRTRLQARYSSNLEDLNNVSIPSLSSSDAAELLHEQQTPSVEDFPILSRSNSESSLESLEKSDPRSGGLQRDEAISLMQQGHTLEDAARASRVMKPDGTIHPDDLAELQQEESFLRPT